MKPFVLASLMLYVAGQFGLHVFLARGEPPWPPIVMLSTLAFFAFALGHGILHWGLTHTAVFLVITAGVSLAFELVGVGTGLIYGSYYYTDRLGPKLFGLVPLFVPVGWFMMAYAAHDLATLITRVGLAHQDARGHPAVWIAWPALVAAGAMTAWDLVMDPQMVATEHWVWVEGGDYFGIPVHNFAGWMVTMLMVYLAYRIYAWRLPSPSPSVGSRWFKHLPALSYALTGLSNIVGNLQIGQPAVALVGIFAMGGFVLAATTSVGGITNSG